MRKLLRSMARAALQAEGVDQIKHLNQQFVENFKIYREGWLEVR